MSQKRTAAQIATSVFNALPHINKVWVDTEAQLFHLDHRNGGVLVEREKLLPPQPVINAAEITQTAA